VFPVILEPLSGNPKMFFDGWSGPLRVFVVGTLAYVGLIILLRVSGKRTLSKMNAFDLVVTVALGSTLATVLLSQDVALAEGMLAFSLLIFLQFAVAWLASRSDRFQRIVKAEPRLLLWNGRLLGDILRMERIAPEEVLAAVRASGQASLESVSAVVLETDGSFSVIPRGKETPTALANIDLPPEPEKTAGPR